MSPHAHTAPSNGGGGGGGGTTVTNGYTTVVPVSTKLRGTPGCTQYNANSVNWQAVRNALAAYFTQQGNVGLGTYSLHCFRILAVSSYRERPFYSQPIPPHSPTRAFARNTRACSHTRTHVLYSRTHTLIQPTRMHTHTHTRRYDGCAHRSVPAGCDTFYARAIPRCRVFPERSGRAGRLGPVGGLRAVPGFKLVPVCIPPLRQGRPGVCPRDCVCPHVCVVCASKPSRARARVCVCV